jgi:hypothetical protein
MYVDSNDEIFYPDEASFSMPEESGLESSQLLETDGRARLGRFKGHTGAIEEERKRIQERVNLKKKQAIKKFLVDVKEKQNRFLTQK